MFLLWIPNLQPTAKSVTPKYVRSSLRRLQSRVSDVSCISKKLFKFLIKCFLIFAVNREYGLHSPWNIKVNFAYLARLFVYLKPLFAKQWYKFKQLLRQNIFLHSNVCDWKMYNTRVTQKVTLLFCIPIDIKLYTMCACSATHPIKLSSEGLSNGQML